MNMRFTSSAILTITLFANCSWSIALPWDGVLFTTPHQRQRIDQPTTTPAQPTTPPAIDGVVLLPDGGWLVLSNGEWQEQDRNGDDIQWVGHGVVDRCISSRRLRQRVGDRDWATPNSNSQTNGQACRPEGD